jgi:hypothetical protein
MRQRYSCWASKNVLFGVKTRPRPTLRGSGHPLQPGLGLRSIGHSVEPQHLNGLDFAGLFDRCPQHNSPQQPERWKARRQEIPTPLPFGLGPARLARSDPIHGVRQKSVSRPDDRARPRCLTARPPLLDAFLAHFGGVFGQVSRGPRIRAPVFTVS